MRWGELADLLKLPAPTGCYFPFSRTRRKLRQAAEDPIYQSITSNFGLRYSSQRNFSFLSHEGEIEITSWGTYHEFMILCASLILILTNEKYKKSPLRQMSINVTENLDFIPETQNTYLLNQKNRELQIKILESCRENSYKRDAMRSNKSYLKNPYRLIQNKAAECYISGSNATERMQVEKISEIAEYLYLSFKLLLLAEFDSIGQLREHAANASSARRPLPEFPIATQSQEHAASASSAKRPLPDLLTDLINIMNNINIDALAPRIGRSFVVKHFDKKKREIRELRDKLARQESLTSDEIDKYTKTIGDVLAAIENRDFYKKRDLQQLLPEISAELQQQKTIRLSVRGS